MSKEIKYFFIFLFVFLISILFSSYVSAVLTYNAGPSLIENSTWYQNLTNMSYSSLAFGDIDNDGDLDLALSGSSSGGKVSKIYTNNGTNLIENSTWQQNLTAMSQGSLAFGDIDNDGDLDLALTGCVSGGGISCTTRTDKVKIYENNGTSFSENLTWQQNLTGIYESSLAFGDIDNDGDLDLALSGSSSGGKISKIYLNNGTALVENKQWYTNLVKVYESGLALGDIDNDGDLDLVLAGDIVPTLPYLMNKIYLNNGTSFIESTTWQQELIRVSEGSFTFIDFDNDKDLDLAHTGTGASGDITRIYENNGTSFDENQTSYDTIAGVYDGCIMFGDIDNDGDLDFGINGNEGTSRIYDNNNSVFYKVTTNRINIKNLKTGSSIAWIDFDNDTDLDLIEVGSDGTNVHALVYTNNLTNNPNEKPTPPISFTNYTTTQGYIHLGWLNGSDNETPSNGLYYNLRVGSTSGGNQIISGKYGGGEDNGYFGNMQQRKNFTLKSDRLSPNTDYYWSVQTIDTGLRTSSWSTEQIFNTSGDLTTPTIILNTINMFNSSTPQLNITFNATVYDNFNVTNVTFWGNWTPSGWHLNQTNSSGLNNSDYIFSVNLLMYNDGYYIWGIKACDNSSLCSISENRTFSIDTTYPEINLILPSNDSTSTSSSITFSYNVSDVHISNCSLIIDGSIQETDYTITTDTTQSISTTLSNGNYNWNINCTDEVNYQNTSQINKITVNYQPSTGSPSTRSGIRAYTGKLEKEEKPIKKIEIKEEHLKEIKIPEKKSRLVRWFETIYAFIISLFMILGYVWIVKKDFKK